MADRIQAAVASLQRALDAYDLGSLVKAGRLNGQDAWALQTVRKIAIRHWDSREDSAVPAAARRRMSAANELHPLLAPRYGLDTFATFLRRREVSLEGVSTVRKVVSDLEAHSRSLGALMTERAAARRTTLGSAPCEAPVGQMRDGGSDSVDVREQEIDAAFESLSPLFRVAPRRHGVHVSVDLRFPGAAPCESEGQEKPVGLAVEFKFSQADLDIFASIIHARLHRHRATSPESAFADKADR